MKNLQDLSFGFLLLTAFTLPMYMRLNNILLGAFVISALIVWVGLGHYRNLRGIAIMGLPVFAFFGLALLGAFRSFGPESFGYLEKYWSLLLLPLVLLGNPGYYTARSRTVFMALTWGCLVTLLICYANVIFEMISGSEPASYFFRWRHLGHQFTEIADTHPTYLAVFIVTAVCFLAQDKGTSYTLKSVLIPFFVLSLFQLASRIGILLMVTLLLFILLQRIRRARWQMASLVFGLVFGGLLIVYYGSDYISERIFSVENLTSDRRVDRWRVSYEIFTENPLVGVGYAEIGSQRQEGYARYGFELAATENLNAHNQFLEYLSTQGAVGGFVYVVSLMYLMLLAVYNRDLLFTFVFLSFFVANLTESMMVRIKGIEYLALFASLFLCSVYPIPKKDEDIHNA